MAVIAPDHVWTEPPEIARYLWDWFQELSAARRYGENGPDPIGFADIEAWRRLTGAKPDTWDVATIRMMDQVYISETIETIKRNREAMT